MGTTKVKIRYIKSYDYKVGLTTGVYGGVGGNGMINVNFFVDRSIIPDSETVEIDEKGQQSEPVREVDGQVAREVLFGTFMHVSDAKIIVAWLNKQIETVEKRLEEKDTNSK